MILAELPCRLDPVQGPAIRFHMAGCRCFLGNRPTRLAVEVTEYEGCTVVVERDPETGEVAETWKVGAE